MKRLRITLIAILFPVLLLGYQYELSIATIFQNEAYYFEEWIDYHRLAGVDHFYLYNNGSTDDYMAVLKPYIKSGVVEVIDFPNVNSKKGWMYSTQPACYRAALDRARGQTKWLCIIDVDEFIVPITKKTVKKEIRNYPPECKAIYANWMTFGTSYKHVKEGDWIILNLTKRAPKHHPNNEHGKSIVQPEYVETCNDPHFMVLKPDCVYYNGSGTELRTGIENQRLRVHHYTYRDETFMRGEKARRVRAWGYSPEETIFRQNDEYNIEDDKTIIRVYNNF